MNENVYYDSQTNEHVIEFRVPGEQFAEMSDAESDKLDEALEKMRAVFGEDL